MTFFVNMTHVTNLHEHSRDQPAAAFTYYTTNQKCYGYK